MYINENPLEVYPSSHSHGSVAYKLFVKESWKDFIFHHFPLPSLQEDVAYLFAFTLPDKKKVSTCFNQTRHPTVLLELG